MNSSSALVIPAHEVFVDPATGTSLRSAHLIGVRGSGMKALAECLLQMGVKVTGSDASPADSAVMKLRGREFHVHRGHDANFLPASADAVIYSPAVGPNNPERRSAARLGIPQYSYTETLGLLTQGRTAVCIAGTHGKSTTSAITGSLLTDAGLDPSAIIGAELIDGQRSGWAGRGPLFVVESCEFQRSFLQLTPHFATILSVEPDHFDCFKNLDETIDAFGDFAARIDEDGLLLIPHENPAAEAAALRSRCRVESLSLNSGSDWAALDLKQTPYGQRFRVFYQGQYLAEMLLQLPGKHSVFNALAGIALAHSAGASISAIRESLAEFGGIRRRYERIGSWRGVTLIDDYAHHPTAVRATLQTARREFGRRRIWCAFQPHQVSRTTALLDDFSASFGHADEVLIPPVFAAREQVHDEPEAVSRQLADQISQRGPSARYVTSLDHILRTLEDEARPGDVFISMGAGDIDRVQHEFTRRLCRYHSA